MVGMKKPLFFLGLLVLICPLVGQGDPYSALRKKMVDEQIFKRGITDKLLLNAFLTVKRHLFVEPENRNLAYTDQPVSIGDGQAIPQPYTAAILAYVIAPDYNKKVLEIGTGSGYQAAILSKMVKQVYTIEIKESLALRAKKLLVSLGYKNIHFKVGDGYNGWEEHGPYDGIIITGSWDHIPEPLVAQLSPGGRMVIPVSYSSTVQELILIEKDDNGELKKTNLIPVQFEPLIRGEREN